MINQDELRRLLMDSESDRVERTISTKNTDKFGEAICAFANDLPNNNQPGYLFIGANDDGSIAGVSITDQLLQNLAAIRTDGNIVPPPALSVQKVSFEQGDLAVVEVQPHHLPPVRYKQQIWIRNGPRRATAGEAEERILNEKRSHYARSFDTLPCRGSSLADLSQAFFRTTYLPLAITDEELIANGRVLVEQMASLKFYDLTAGSPTFAGLLVFGTNPLYFLPGAYIQFVQFAGDSLSSDVVNETLFSGPLITLLSDLDSFVKNQVVHQRPVGASYLREQQLFDFPYIAIRESLMNALLHRDYQSNSPIRFYQFSDRIEIQNPGGLFGAARPENFPKVNDYRNPALAEVMKVTGYVNRFNRGISRIQTALETNKSPAPVFEKDQPTYFGVTLYRHPDYENADLLQ
ncbi:ATP-binding protein [Spirosoma montaniterrae]|uniref:Transcriptional regulator n=1 Tax=Spirosoma montaniterrae TaxID=1178516 RepID=A0A1P9WW50_9BACT|nr:ATP-binding protein [Spirosoma montaniterrae]AQG79604.1 transcriptional regulator [Spirosoma montaniterrae]